MAKNDKTYYFLFNFRPGGKIPIDLIFFLKYSSHPYLTKSIRLLKNMYVINGLFPVSNENSTHMRVSINLVYKSPWPVATAFHAEFSGIIRFYTIFLPPGRKSVWRWLHRQKIMFHFIPDLIYDTIWTRQQWFTSQLKIFLTFWHKNGMWRNYDKLSTQVR